ncbi:hypothetical protein Ccrd_021763, partial [Cynara cardunculus var. scolymus]
ATEGLQIRVKKIKEVFSGGIKSLVGLATEFSGNSETALSNINSEAVKHSSALAKLIREASVKTLSKDIFGVIQMVEEARTMYYKKLSEFTKKFEVQTEVNDIQSYIGSKTYMLHHKVSDMHGFLSSTEDEYTSFLEKTKKHYIEDKIVTQNGQDDLLRINHEENEAINSLTKRSRDTMKDMETVHSAKIIEITKDAEKCLINDYMVDDSLFSTPKLCKLPSKTHTKELKTPPFEVLLDSFRKSRSEKQENADLNAVSFGTINGG